MELTPEIICQAMAPYYKQPLVICEPGIEPVSHYLEGVDYCNGKIIAERINYDPKWIKLLLKPLSDITDEHVLEVSKIMGYTFQKVLRLNPERYCIIACHHHSKGKVPYPKSEHVVISFPPNEPIVIHYCDNADYEQQFEDAGLAVYQYLQTKGYDLPHYLLGGKTLHEAGLCIYDNQELKK